MELSELNLNGPFFGDWTAKSVIGTGSCGTVYLMTRGTSGDKCAMKVICAKTSLNLDEVNEVFDRYKDLEGRGNVFVEHETMNKEIDGKVYVFEKMPYLPSLAIYASGCDLDKEEIARLGSDVCTALEYCEYKGITHGNIKPTNIFVNDDGGFVLGDFGSVEIAKIVGDYSSADNCDFSSPEVYRDSSFDNTADIYSLGMVLYTQLNGKRGPFLPPEPESFTMDDLEAATKRRMSGETFENPARGGDEFAKIINKACQTDPEKRYFSAAKMKSDLKKITGGAAATKAPSVSPAKTTAAAAGVFVSNNKPAAQAPKNNVPSGIFSSSEPVEEINIAEHSASDLKNSPFASAIIMPNEAMVKKNGDEDKKNVPSGIFASSAATAAAATAPKTTQKPEYYTHSSYTNKVTMSDGFIKNDEEDDDENKFLAFLKSGTGKLVIGITIAIIVVTILIIILVNAIKTSVSDMTATSSVSNTRVSKNIDETEESEETEETTTEESEETEETTTEESEETEETTTEEEEETTTTKETTSATTTTKESKTTTTTTAREEETTTTASETTTTAEATTTTTTAEVTTTTTTEATTTTTTTAATTTTTTTAAPTTTTEATTTSDSDFYADY